MVSLWSIYVVRGFLTSGVSYPHPLGCPVRREPVPPFKGEMTLESMFDEGLLLIRTMHEWRDTCIEDRQEAWFRATTLVHDTGDAIRWVPNYGGQDYVIHESIREDSNPT